MDVLIDNLDYNIDCTNNIEDFLIRRRLNTLFYVPLPLYSNLIILQKPNTIEYKIIINNDCEDLYAYIQTKDFIHLQLHRKQNPAYIRVANNNIRNMCFFKNGLFHNENGPAALDYNVNGLLIGERWWKDAQFHRLNGPAFIQWNLEPIKLWYVNGKLINKLPKVENGKVCNDIQITKSTIIEAMLFDREYGEFLKKIYEQGK